MEIKQQEIGVMEGRAFHEDASEVGVCEDKRSGMGGGRVMKPNVWLEVEGCSCSAVSLLKGFNPEVTSPGALRRILERGVEVESGTQPHPSVSTSLCQSARKKSRERTKDSE